MHQSNASYYLCVSARLSIVEIESRSTLEKKKVSIKFQLLVHKQETCFALTSDRVLVITCCSTTGKKKVKYALTFDIIG